MGVVGGGWGGAAYADGGEGARSKAAVSASDETPAQGYARGILQALADDDGNRWVRYWRAWADCEAARAAYGRDNGDGAAMERVLLGLTGMLCARLDARLGVNPRDYLPREEEERTVGLVASEAGMAVGYTLFTSMWNYDVFLLDPLGRVAHAWRLDASFDHAKLLDNGNLLAAISSGIFEFDPCGNVVWQYRIDGLHHDFIKMPNGNILMLIGGRKVRDEVIAAGANPEFVQEAVITYDYLIEARPTGASGGEVVWEWSAWDHLVQDFDPSKPNYGAVAEHPELIDINFLPERRSSSQRGRNWTHANSVDYNPELDQIMLSPRHFSELWIIDHSADAEEARGHSGGNSGMGGDLLYRWGNPRAYGHGDGDDQRLFWQHQPHWIAPGLPGEGNILVFNNGYEFPSDERFYSSVDEIIPPVDGYRYRRDEGAAYPPDGIEWTYAAETPVDFYAPLFSSAQRLPNGNTLIVDGTAGTIFQATPGGRIVWKYVAPLDRRAHLRQGERASVQRTFPTPYGDPVPRLTNSVYRAYWYPPDYPGLRALDLTPGDFIEDIYAIAHKAVIAGDFEERLAGSIFDIYLDKGGDEGGRRLIYFKQPCAAEDTRAEFFLHIIPVDARDLPDDRREHGFDNLDFGFSENGGVSDGRCIAIRALPDYPIERIRTGQYTSAGQVWRAEIELGE